jgi:hypothetical protein
MRFDSSFDIGVVRSESVTDLNSELMGGSGMRDTRGRPSNMPGFGKVSGDGDHISPSSKPFGLGEYAVSLVSFSTLYIKAHYWYMNFLPVFSSWSLIYTCRKTFKSLLVVAAIKCFSFVSGLLYQVCVV